MPIYEYRCEACQHELEALQKISDEPLVVCPKCEAPSLRKQVSAAGFRLKGGGWYETDFKSGSKKNVAGDTQGPSESGKSESSKNESSSADSGKSDAAAAKPASETKTTAAS